MRPLSRRTYAIAAVVLAAIIFVALNIAANATFTSTRLDLTENGQYTLARGTKNVVGNLQEPIVLKFFYSRKTAADYAQVAAYANRVRDLLKEYVSLSHGKLVLEEFDPEPFSEAEDQARANGLTGAPTQSGDPVYFGLVGTNTINGKETVPFFAQDREPYLEYDLSSLVYRLSHPKRPKIAILSSLPLQAGPGGMMAMLQGNSRPYLLYQQLTQTYNTQMLSPGASKIPDGTDVLLIVHPAAVSDAQSYAIDQFVLRGGRALVMVDPSSDLAASASQGFQRSAGATPSDMPKLFRAWGIEYNVGKVVGDRALAQQVQTNDPHSPVQAYPIWLHLTADQFNHGDQVTASLQTLNLSTVGALSPLKGATTTFTPLISSSPDAGLLDVAQVHMGTQPDQLMAAIVPTGHPFAIAARISGPAKTAFPKGPPANPADKSKPPAKQLPQLMASKDGINIIVLADSDIFDDKFWVRIQTVYGRQMGVPFADNAAFVLNAVENLTGSGDLISLRTRAASDRPFTVVQKLQQQAQARFQQQAQGLQQKLADTQQRLTALQQGASQPGQPNKAAGLSAQQQREIQRFQREVMDTRAKLRGVQRNLRSNIDRLGNILAFANIALVPLLVALFAITLAVLRRRRRARAIAF
jgi:ABC-type uncharacterized transport system involved in gliding motility auxiliary subunit